MNASQTASIASLPYYFGSGLVALFDQSADWRVLWSLLYAAGIAHTVISLVLWRRGTHRRAAGGGSA